jgi:hypothetical protein
MCKSSEKERLNGWQIEARLFQTSLSLFRFYKESKLKLVKSTCEACFWLRANIEIIPRAEPGQAKIFLIIV